MKNMFLKSVMFVCLLCMSCVLFAFDIAKYGKTDCIVVIPKDANPAEKYASEEFVKYIEKSSGVKLEIKTEAQKYNNIFIQTRKDVTSDWDTVHFAVKDKNLYLTGDNDRGTIYSVYEFLEQHVGVKYFNDDRIIVPKKNTVSVSNYLNYTHKPSFMMRDTSDVSCSWKPFGVMTKLNCNHATTKPEYGGRLAVAGCHTLKEFLPVEKYGKEHPEFYAMKAGSRYVMAESQPCMSNLEMRKELAKNVIAKLDKSNEKNVIDVSQNDNRLICECDACKKKIKEYGNYTDLFIEAINYVADEVKKKYPDTIVETLAYQTTRQAPKTIKPRENVMLRLCSIECNFAEPIGLKDKNAPYKTVNSDSSRVKDINTTNKDFDRDLSDWSKLSKNIFIWDYIVNFHNCYIPHPNFQVLKSNLEYFRKHNVLGVYGESNRDNYNSSFDELRNYIEAKLLWDISLDPKKLTKEFCDGVYGAGSRDIQKCIDIFTDIFRRDHYYVPTYVEDMNWMSDDEIIQSVGLYKSALEKTKNDTYCYDRIMTLYMSFLAGWYLLPDDRFENVKNKCSLPWETKTAFYKDFIAYNDNPIKRNTHWKEHVPFDISKTAKNFVKVGSVPEVCKGLKHEDWWTMSNIEINPSPNWGATIQNDPSASGGKVVLLKNNNDWGAHENIAGNIAQDIKAGYKGYKIYAICKAVGKKSDEGDAFRIGLYDYDIKKRVHRETRPLSSIGEDWTCVDFGEYKFEEIHDIHIYFVGCKNENFDWISVDKIIFIRQ